MIPTPLASIRSPLFMRTSEDWYGLARCSASLSSTEAWKPSPYSRRRTVCQILLFGGFRKMGRDISGWPRIMASFDFIRYQGLFDTTSESDGLPGNLLNPNGAEGCWQSPSGEMVFGSTKGVTTFYPDRLSPSPYVPPVVLTEFRLFNKAVERGPDFAPPQADLGDGFPDAHAHTEYLHAGIRRFELRRAGEEPVSLSAGESGIRMERSG